MNDPCDELSDGLTEILLLNVRFERLTREQRRQFGNSMYGKFGTYTNLPYEQFTRLVRPLLEKIWAKCQHVECDSLIILRRFETEYPRDPDITFAHRPGGYHVKHDTP